MRLSLFTLICLAIAAQSTTRLEFEAASLKVDDGIFDPRIRVTEGGPGTKDPGRITWNRMSLAGLIVQAYNVAGDQIFGFPDNPHKFTLTATFPVTTMKEQLRIMLQNLLSDRFHLALHRETRNFPGYEVILAPGGPKLHSWTPDPDASPRVPGKPLEPGQGGFYWSTTVKPPMIHVASRQSMPDFAVALRMLQTYADNTRGDEERDQELMAALQRGSARALASPRFVDKTGLAGQFELNLDFEGAMLPRASEGGPTLPEALEKQLGLKLVKTKGVPLDVVVIDHVDKEPTEN